MNENLLIAACFERPDAIDARLVYADWLDENYQPIEAKLVRLEVERLKHGTKRARIIGNGQDHLGTGHFYVNTSEFNQVYYGKSVPPGLRIDMDLYVRRQGDLKRVRVCNLLLTKSEWEPPSRDGFYEHGLYLRHDRLSGFKSSASRERKIRREMSNLLWVWIRQEYEKDRDCTIRLEFWSFAVHYNPPRLTKTQASK